MEPPENDPLLPSTLCIVESDPGICHATDERPIPPVGTRLNTYFFWGEVARHRPPVRCPNSVQRLVQQGPVTPDAFVILTQQVENGEQAVTACLIAKAMVPADDLQQLFHGGRVIVLGHFDRA